VFVLIELRVSTAPLSSRRRFSGRSLSSTEGALGVPNLRFTPELFDTSILVGEEDKLLLIVLDILFSFVII
jgi:hypothetical protein